VIPTNAGVANVWAGVPGARFAELARPSLAHGLDAMLARVAPELAEHVRTSASDGPVRGFPGVAGLQRVPVGPGWALVGDAGYFKDPITAHGITDALRDAELLADAVVAAAAGDQGAFEEYHRTRDALSAELRDVTEQIAGYGWDHTEVYGLLRDLSAAQRAENRWLALKEPDGLAPAALKRAA
jgi:flavin-dependent dehydrogenase